MRRVRSRLVATRAARGNGATTLPADHLIHRKAGALEQYFSDGISEELLNLLARILDLRGRRTSSFSFKRKNVGIQESAKRLNVAYVLEDSVRRAGNQVRITAQLIGDADGFHVSSATYDRKLDDIFPIQDEIAAAVVKQLQIALLGNVPTTHKTKS
jgi:adenylate cyclase